MTSDLSVDRPLLLGTVGWNRSDWLIDYFPSDLPPEWRLAYLGNDSDCVLLPAADWCAGEAGVPKPLAEALEEVSEELVFLLEKPPPETPSSLALAAFDGHPAWLVQEATPPAPGDWTAIGGERISAWYVETFDLRAWRDRACELGPGTRALVLDGPAASPARLSDLRTLVQLLGIA